MSTPRTEQVYDSVAFFANEDEATEALGKMRDLARELEEELNEANARLAGTEATR